MRRVAWSLAALLILLAMLVVAGAWMTTTASGFRWLTATVTALSGERLKFEGVDGHLARPAQPLVIRR